MSVCRQKKEKSPAKGVVSHRGIFNDIVLFMSRNAPGKPILSVLNIGNDSPHAQEHDRGSLLRLSSCQVTVTHSAHSFIAVCMALFILTTRYRKLFSILLVFAILSSSKYESAGIRVVMSYIM